MTTIYTPLPFHHEWHVTSLENSENLQLKSHVITARLHIYICSPSATAMAFGSVRQTKAAEAIYI